MTAVYTDDAQLNLLRRVLGRRVVWIYATPFIIEGDLAVATRMALSLGPGPDRATIEYLSLGSDRYETENEQLDYAQFRIRHESALSVALGTTGTLFADTSALVGLGQEAVQCVRVFAASVHGDREEILYDAAIELEFDGGRVLAFGHAPRVYEGVCVSHSERVTLGNPQSLLERVLLTR